VEPTARPAGAAGFITMEVNAEAGTTVTATDVLVFPDRAAVILVLPGATPVATPLVAIVAVAVLELVHVAWVLRSAVVLSEYVPTAVNCIVEPATRLGGASGCTASEINIGVGFEDVVILAVVTNVPAVVFDEQDVALKSKAAIIPIVRHKANNFVRLIFIISFPFQFD
jgi:hypothetical protein